MFSVILEEWKNRCKYMSNTFRSVSYSDCVDFISKHYPFVKYDEEVNLWYGKNNSSYIILSITRQKLG